MGLFCRKQKSNYDYDQDSVNIEEIVEKLNEIAENIRIETFKKEFERAADALYHTSRLNGSESEKAFAEINKQLENYKDIIDSQKGELDTFLTDAAKKVLTAVNKRIKMGGRK